MDIIRLDPGVSAPLDSDCISIEQNPDGRFFLTGAALRGDESVAMVGGPTYDSYEAAEAEGLAWAESNEVATLHIASDRG
ncbi:hypothetical protein [Sphingomonas solaris]|uniref:DUF1508 domain-containing protein n=1 Tax=Alterirhizorhabdus solaris TaxID=2529389 RepID=A0A558QU68_9SPHN|nr:hypothetical protein [Sphingomonas solaris]TVV70700.1 hypothetical protein FOY91_18460 [Sphingomonas solaris]